MNETATELKLALMLAMQATLEPEGFKLVKTKHCFVRKHAEGRDSFVLDSAVYNKLQVKPTILLRLDEVENIFHRTSGYEKKYQSETPTLAATLQQLCGDPARFEYKVADRQDVAETAAQLVKDFEDVALPYFNTNRDLKRVDFLLNDDPHNESVHYAMTDLRCAHGLITAKLTGRPDYEELVRIYSERLRQTDKGFYLPKLQALIADLAAQSA